MRGDLADVSLAGLLFAPHYAKAKPMHCATSAAYVRKAPSAEAVAVSQILAGEGFHVLDIAGGWAWGFCEHDGYVGYVDAAMLADGLYVATHRIMVRSAPAFASADIKSPVMATLSAGARVGGEISGDFLMTALGAVHKRHLVPIDVTDRDWVIPAMRQMGQPYVWGGRGHDGIDCSGLVQIALAQAGLRVPRDSDMQREGIGEAIPDDAPLRRGDFLFFPGHVGIMVDEARLLHANAYWMGTVVEPLVDVIARLQPDHEEPVLARRRIMS